MMLMLTLLLVVTMTDMVVTPEVIERRDGSVAGEP